MDNRKKKGKKTTCLYYSLLIILLAGFCAVAYAGYKDNLKQVLNKSILSSMEESGSQNIRSLNCRIQSVWDYMEGMQQCMEEDTFPKADGSLFRALWVLDENDKAWDESGASFAYDHTSWGSLTEEGTGGFIRAVPGENQESEIICGFADGTAIPWNQTKRVGIAGRISRDWIESCVQWSSMDGSAKSSVIDKNGTYILGYELPEAKAVLSDMKEGSRTFTRVTYQGEKYFVYAHALENADWYLVTSVPLDVVSQRANVFTLRSTIFFGIMVAVILILFLYVMHERHKSEVAIESERAKTVFLSNMSHEIRTPLNGIIGLLYLLRQNTGDKETTEEYLDKMEASAVFLRDIVTGILDMSKIESGQMELIENPVDLRETIHEVAQIIQGHATEKGVGFQATCVLPEPVVSADGFRLKQILVNLLGNAVKFTDKNGAVSLTVTQEQRDKLYTVFVIADNGCGMSGEFQTRIWKPFEQEFREHSQNGTGLGATLSKALTERMGGSISMESKVGEGTVFTVSIPFEPAEKAESAEPPEAFKKTGTDGTIRVLLADDNDINREVLHLILAEQGFEVDEVCNGKEAVERFQKSRAGSYDVILMDIQMPVLNGYEAAEQIRDLARADAGTVKIIAVTANAFREDIDRAERAGMNEVITKPVDIEKLLGVIGNRRDEKDDR